MITAEPILESGKRAEAAFQQALVTAVREFTDGTNKPCVLIERFGLDVALFFSDQNCPPVKLLELKAFVGGRVGGVGFGNKDGHGPQIDLLWNSQNNTVRSPEELKVFDNSVRWILAHGLKKLGTPRYAIFTCAEAQKAAMGGVQPGKQNNLRVSAFDQSLLTWEELNNKIRSFLFD